MQKRISVVRTITLTPAADNVLGRIMNSFGLKRSQAVEMLIWKARPMQMDAAENKTDAPTETP